MSIKDGAIKWSKDIYQDPRRMDRVQGMKLGVTALAVFVGIYFAATIFSTVAASILIIAGLAALGASVRHLSSKEVSSEALDEKGKKDKGLGTKTKIAGGLIALALVAVAVAFLAPAYVPASLVAYKVAVLVGALIAGTLLLGSHQYNKSSEESSKEAKGANSGRDWVRIGIVVSLASVAAALVAAAYIPAVAAYIPASVAIYGSTAGSYATTAANGAYVYTTGTLFPMVTSGLLMALGLSIGVAVFVNRQVNKLLEVKREKVELQKVGLGFAGKSLEEIIHKAQEQVLLSPTPSYTRVSPHPQFPDISTLHKGEEQEGERARERINAMGNNT